MQTTRRKSDLRDLTIDEEGIDGHGHGHHHGHSHGQQRVPTAEEKAEYRANGPDHDAKVKFDVKDEVDDDADNNMNVTQKLKCKTCEAVFLSMIALVKHKVEV